MSCVRNGNVRFVVYKQPSEKYFIGNRYSIVCKGRYYLYSIQRAQRCCQILSHRESSGTIWRRKKLTLIIGVAARAIAGQAAAVTDVDGNPPRPATPLEPRSCPNLTQPQSQPMQHEYSNKHNINYWLITAIFNGGNYCHITISWDDSIRRHKGEAYCLYEVYC